MSEFNGLNFREAWSTSAMSFFSDVLYQNEIHSFEIDRIRKIQYMEHSYYEDRPFPPINMTIGKSLTKVSVKRIHPEEAVVYPKINNSFNDVEGMKC